MERWQPVFFVLILGLVGCASSSNMITDNFAESSSMACFNARNFKFLMLSMTSISMSETEANESIFCLP